MNFMFALDSGDIGFFATGLFPRRKHNIVQGVYSKRGDRIENKWEGFFDGTELPYVVNPEKGYLVNCNNFIGSDRMNHGISHGFGWIHRKVRISELIEGLIKEGKKITMEDMKTITFDILDVQMRQSVPDMLKSV